MFLNAKPIEKYERECRARGESWRTMRGRLVVLDTRWAEYGNWILYADNEGNLWEEYESIGD